MKISTLTASTAVFAAAVCAATVAEASSNPTTGQVTAASLNVRTGPGTNHTVVGSLSYGTSINILGQSGSWYKIMYKEKEAYVHSTYVNTAGALSLVPDNTENMYKIRANALNVRSEPSIKSSILGVLQNGQTVSVQSEQNGWYQISFNGKTAYIKKEYATPVHAEETPVESSAVDSSSSYYVDVAALRVRSGAGIQHDVVGIMHSGEKVQVVGEEGDWYKVRFNGKDAFMAKRYIALKEEAQESPTPTPSSTSISSFQWPSAGALTSTFGMRWGEMHYGIDIAAPGTVAVNSIEAGTVVKSYYSSSYGNVVFISHTVEGQLYTSVYAHLKSRSLQQGDTVEKGQLVGYMGNTGHSTGQHLHFELHRGEWNYAKTNAVDPLLFMNRPQ